MYRVILIACVFIFFNSLSHAQSEFVFSHYNQANEPELGGNNFKAVAVGKDGHIWAGSQYHGLVKYDPVDSSWESALDLSNVFISDIKADHHGNIWVANAGRSGMQGGGSNIAGGISQYPGNYLGVNNFYTITAPGWLTSRNVRSIWIDKINIDSLEAKVWVAQGTFISSNNTQAGGFSVGKNHGSPYFTKGYIGLQVTPYVPTSQARTPSLLAIGGYEDEVWIFAQGNFSTNQILRYRTDAGPHAFLGAYDHTNTPVLTAGFRANAIYFDDQERGWIGQQNGGIIIKSGDVWKTMNDPSIIPPGTIVNPNAITSDQLGNVYIGTSNGLVIYRGGPVDVATSYRRVTTSDGLPTNNINGIAEDTLAKRIILAHSAGISFMRYKKKIDALLDWDHSFPIPGIKPKGVVTDGISRLYIKVKRDTTLTTAIAIKKIALSMKQISGQVQSMIGKLKVANVLSGYTNEANSGTALEVSRTDSTPTGEFNFWYVAPDDFSADSLSSEAQLNEREDSIKVKITYADDSEDSSYIAVKLQRPPLMMGGMMSGIGKIFKKILLTNGTPLLQSDLFVKKLGHIMNPMHDLAGNISRLLDGDILQNEDRDNSIQGMLENVRKMGFAANRVDFVGQGLAANVMRAAAAIKQNKFFADGGFMHNNYGKGFINKFISVNGLHNGSPIFDMVKELLPGLNEISKKLIYNLIRNNVDSLLPYPFVQPSDTTLSPLRTLIEKGLIDSNIFKLPLTNIKNHLLVSTVEATPAEPEKIKPRGFLGKIGGHLAMVLRDHPTLFKDTLTNSFQSIFDLNQKLFKFTDIFASLKGITDFNFNSDQIASLFSQTAGQAASLPHITKMEADSAEHVSHGGFFGKIGGLLKNLLNTSINSNAFGDIIPASLPSISNSLPNIGKIVQTLFDTTKIVTVDRQIDGLRAAQNDTTITLHYRVKDTVGLQYIFVSFQDSLYTTTSKERDQQVTLKVKRVMEFSGLQDIAAVGVYENADSIIYHADTTRTYVTPPDSIQGFRVTQQEVDLHDDNLYYPTYQVMVQGEWQTLPASDTSIKIAIDDPALLEYSATELAFTAVGDGYTLAIFTYKQYKDTVTFETLLSLRRSAINRSITSGNFSDSATWSKGRPPLPGDSVIIVSGHAVVLDNSAQVRSLLIENGATLTLNQPAHQLQLGDAEDGSFVVNNFGTLAISNGMLTVRGRVKLNAGSTFNMTGGNLVIDGNTGHTITSLSNGLFLFEAAPQMNLFSFTGGTLQIIDPPLGVASQALSCPYSFGPNSTLVLGNGVSTTASNNPNGFGGSLFPPVIGKLVLDAGTGANNRVLNITSPVHVKGRLDVKAGSKINLQAELKLTQ